jgi:uncharacterized protein (TIGR03067 family)
MKTLQSTLTLAIIAFAVATGWAADEKAIEKDQGQLQGEWTMISGARDGQAFPDDFMKGSKRVAKGNETTVIIGGQLLMKAKFTLEPSSKPKHIDYEVTDGANQGKSQLGIYEVTGEQVKFCFSTPGGARPTEFATKPGDGRTLSVWKKEKK